MPALPARKTTVESLTYILDGGRAATMGIDRKEVRGDLLTQFNEAEFFLKRHMSLQGIIEGMKRRNVYEVPQEAWREAIANAIIHRDYNSVEQAYRLEFSPIE